uniref:NADPH-dependent diflavin oxidoreductase 1 n=1 Tax=Cucumis melo TaxID=3656 RepID=A0A9I9DFR7_CUCME
MKDQPELLILYATQTGNAQDAAERLGREAEHRGCVVRLLSMDEYDASHLPHEDGIIFVVSTTGQGETPDSMRVFWKFLLQRSLDQYWLKGVPYAVFGLGDSSYQKYNGTDFVFSNDTIIDQPSVQVAYYNMGKLDSPLTSARNEARVEQMPHLTEVVLETTLLNRLDADIQVEVLCFEPQGWVQMIKNQCLSKVGSGKDVRHFEFEFVSSVIEYEVGDVLEVLPSQSSAAVNAFIQRCNLDPESFITVSPRNRRKQDPILAAEMGPVMSYYATAPHEKERLQYFASPEGRDDLYQYNQKERRSVLEVLEDFPSVKMPFDWLVQLVPPLKTRSFSISSSALAHPNQVHLTVNVVSWMTPYKRKRSGLCSSVHVPVWFHKGSLPAPAPSLPLILVGPGTGCAPFRGFVEERSIENTSMATAPVLFFFGCRNEDNDFLYRDFWLSHSENHGVLSEEKGGGFYVAFSRDQPRKVYVQHKMLEQSEKIWNLLREGAAVYVAGSSTKMPADVWSTFEEIISKETQLPRESAVRWLRALEKADYAFH